MLRGRKKLPERTRPKCSMHGRIGVLLWSSAVLLAILKDSPYVFKGCWIESGCRHCSRVTGTVVVSSIEAGPSLGRQGYGQRIGMEL